MLVNVARNGVNLGAFEHEEMKRMAADGALLQTDHVYLTNAGRWEQISHVPELQATLFPLVNMFEPPVPYVRLAGNPLHSGVPLDPDMELYHGYSKCYWKTYFGKNTYWFLDKCKDLPTLEEERSFNENVKIRKEGEGAVVGLLKRQERQKEYGNKQIVLSLPGFVFGWGWLAYRKVGSVFGIYAGLSVATGLLGLMIHDPERQTALQIKLWGFQFFAFSIWPCCWGVSMLHRRAQKVIRDVHLETQVHTERLERIRELGGTSAWWAIGFVCFMVGFEVVLDAILS